ncbi:MAG TPA: chitobiase/beta-hexosaminidase C-terminal domain-containing protein, partial [bacterium]|nr:chitobiase/beta-hexosaminidase C-terminal domain-containing protein [bacterium]
VANGVLYQAEVPLNVTKIKALAIKEGMEDSEITESNYSVTAPNSPTFNPSDTLHYVQNLNVSLIPPALGCDEIRYVAYTDPNSEPSPSNVYSGPINVTTTGTIIRAICIKAGISSAESSATYILRLLAPKIKHISCPLTPGGNISLSDFNLISNLHAGLPETLPTQMSITCTRCIEVTLTEPIPAPYKIYLRTSYTDPASLGSNAPITTSWMLYTEPKSCTTVEATVPSAVNNFNVEAFVTKAGMTPSEIVTQAFAR